MFEEMNCVVCGMSEDFMDCSMCGDMMHTNCSMYCAECFNDFCQVCIDDHDCEAEDEEELDND